MRVRVDPEIRDGIVVHVEPSVLHLLAAVPPIGPRNSAITLGSQIDTIPIPLIRVLHVYRPDRSTAGRRVQGGILGGLVGAAAGTLLGVGIGAIAENQATYSEGYGILLGGFAGLIAGTAVGVVYGASREPSPWEYIPVPRRE